MTFGFSTTAAEVAAGVNLSGKRAIVTGGASGLGLETARAIASTGASVTLAVRDAGLAVEIEGDVRVAHLDLTDIASIRSFVSEWDGPLDILVNNAGVMAAPETYTRPGWELQFATNHMGHFALATGLHPALRAAGEARIVVVSSSGHQLSPVVFDDINFAFRPYGPWLAYGQSKTANVLFAVEATRRWAADGTTANALMPGAIHTNLQRHTPGGRGSGKIPPELIRTPQQGAATSVLLATSPLVKGVGGRYFFNCAETEVLDRRATDMHGVARYAIDPANASRLWTVSQRLLDNA